jgi:diguanylate cyclase (GGDEF)-like protein
MKLIIQIPCYNEEQTLPITLQSLPRQVEGFDKVEWLIIDDGSSDRSIDVAKEQGVDHIVRLNTRKRLAEVFLRGLDACVKLGADVIVNTDADNQYDARDIPNLTKPIIERKADIVVGTRPVTEIPHFSPIKKILQRLGSWVVGRLSYTHLPDAPSGFRAISRDAAMQLNVFNTYTYTLETIIQAGNKNIAVTSVPIRVNEELRPSRLIKSIPSYIMNSMITIVRMFIVYRPFKTFMSIGLIIFFTGFLIGLRFLYLKYILDEGGHVQSLILVGTLLGFGFQTMLVAFMADLLAVNRRLLEDVQNRVKKIECERIYKDLASLDLGLRKTLETESIRDSLTGLYNQRYMKAFLEQEVHRAGYRNAPVGIIILEVDHFTTFTDTYGQEAGNNVLRELGTLLRNNTREEDIACHYREEEFLLILPNAPLEIARQRAENLRRRVKELQIAYQDKFLTITVSLGVAALPNQGPDAKDAVNAAATAVYQAKASGHDQVVVASY